MNGLMLIPFKGECRKSIKYKSLFTFVNSTYSINKKDSAATFSLIGPVKTQ